MGGITETLTSAVGNSGVYAVFGLMALDAVFPAGSEIVMLYAGAVAAGAFTGSEVHVFGWEAGTGIGAYVVMALAGTLGYLVGAIVGWLIGLYGGRPLLERHGRWFHATPEKLDRAERWFQRYEVWTVFVGRLVPLVRSFISIPAGWAEVPFVPYTLLTLAASAIWCFAFAGIGYGLGTSWDRLHEQLRWLDYLILAAVGLGVLYLVVRTWRRRRRGPAAEEGV